MRGLKDQKEVRYRSEENRGKRDPPERERNPLGKVKREG